MILENKINISVPKRFTLLTNIKFLKRIMSHNYITYKILQWFTNTRSNLTISKETRCWLTISTFYFLKQVFIKLRVLHIHIVVVPVMLVFIVVFSMLVYTVRFLLPTGILALPYHLNKATSTAYYAFRGGYSDPGLYCGAFCVVASNTWSYTSWYRGAALSFKPSLLFIFRFNYI